jgi:hypothetical protein
MKRGQPAGIRIVKMIDHTNAKLVLLVKGHSSRKSLRIKCPGKAGERDVLKSEKSCSTLGIPAVASRTKLWDGEWMGRKKGGRSSPSVPRSRQL